MQNLQLADAQFDFDLPWNNKCQRRGIDKGMNQSSIIMSGKCLVPNHFPMFEKEWCSFRNWFGVQVFAAHRSLCDRRKAMAPWNERVVKKTAMMNGHFKRTPFWGPSLKVTRNSSATADQLKTTGHNIKWTFLRPEKLTFTKKIKRICSFKSLSLFP